MVNRRLQPALKYIAPNPMYNRYGVNKDDRTEYKEIVTMPTISGDLKIQNRHVGVNFDDRDIPQKYLPSASIEPKQKQDLEGIAKTL